MSCQNVTLLNPSPHYVPEENRVKSIEPKTSGNRFLRVPLPPRDHRTSWGLHPNYKPLESLLGPVSLSVKPRAYRTQSKMVFLLDKKVDFVHQGTRLTCRMTLVSVGYRPPQENCPFSSFIPYGSFSLVVKDRIGQVQR